MSFMLVSSDGSVMEQTLTRKGHRDAVLVAGHDDVIVADGAAGLGDVVDAALFVANGYSG